MRKLVKTCLKTEEEVKDINFETFVRVFALLLEENMNKLSIEEPAKMATPVKPEVDTHFVKKLLP